MGLCTPTIDHADRAAAALSRSAATETSGGAAWTRRRGENCRIRLFLADAGRTHRRNPEADRDDLLRIHRVRNCEPDNRAAHALCDDLRAVASVLEEAARIPRRRNVRRSRLAAAPCCRWRCHEKKTFIAGEMAVFVIVLFEIIVSIRISESAAPLSRMARRHSITERPRRPACWECR